MAVGEITFPHIESIAGVRMASATAGIYPDKEREDVALFEFEPSSSVAIMFTRNAFAAAPVIVAKKHLVSAKPLYLLINSGNANAGMGGKGIINAQTCCNAVARKFAVKESQVLPFSTGVIGGDLPTEKIIATMDDLEKRLDSNSWQSAAKAIMTTDTYPKGAYRQINTANGQIRIAGIAKGSGMIRPDMATMLVFIFTDAKLPNDLLQHCLARAVAESFHCITIDGDTSTNDAVCLVATGLGTRIEQGDPNILAEFQKNLTELCIELAQSVVRDGEGATKFITIAVSEGKDKSECRQVAFTVAHSPLVKTAFFASDPNWGRILAAIGRAGLHELDIQQLRLYLGEMCIMREGERSVEYDETQATELMTANEITLNIRLGRGDASSTIWTADLSHEYITINAGYRS